MRVTIRCRTAVVALSLASIVIAGLWLVAAWRLAVTGRARPEAGARFDAIIVLGCRVRPDGSASPALKRRVAFGCALLREGLAPRLVISGGRVGAPISEAEAAKSFVLAEGLAPADALVLETESTSTATNASRSRALLGDAHVLVVTDDWHVPRARRLFVRCFSRVAMAGAPTDLRRKWRGAVREVPLWALARLRGG